jgi:hypothetical protein
MNAIQLDFLRSAEECEIIELRRQIAAIHESTGKVRRGIFAKHGELMKRQMELEGRLQHIERGLCSMSKSTNMC